MIQFKNAFLSFKSRFQERENDYRDPRNMREFQVPPSIDFRKYIDLASPYGTPIRVFLVSSVIRTRSKQLKDSILKQKFWLLFQITLFESF